jgi:hypothetical protein
MPHLRFKKHEPATVSGNKSGPALRGVNPVGETGDPAALATHSRTAQAMQLACKRLRAHPVAQPVLMSGLLALLALSAGCANGPGLMTE